MKKARVSKKKPVAGRAFRSNGEAKDLDAKLAPIARAFEKDARVSTSGRGFGAGTLKVNGKIFALISARGEYVVKLSRARVSALIEAGQGRHFDAGKGKPMREWLVVSSQEKTWLALAREAHAFVLGESGTRRTQDRHSEGL